MTYNAGNAWSVRVCPRGFLVVDTRSKIVAIPLRQRWHWANHPIGDPRRRHLVGMWITGSRPLIFVDYRKALRTAKRLNATGRDMHRHYEERRCNQTTTTKL